MGHGMVLTLVMLVTSTTFSAGLYRRAVFYHHSTGGCFYDRQQLYDSSTPSSTATVPKEVAKYNASKGYTGGNAVVMDESTSLPADGDNQWSTWANRFAAGMTYTYPVIIIKTCYIQQQTMTSSSDIDALKVSYRAIVKEMSKHPNNFFVIWNNMPAPTDGNSSRAAWSAAFSVWCKDVLAKGLDTYGAFPKNVYVFDVFRKLADPVTGVCPTKYGDPGDDHPSSESVNIVTPQFVKEVFDASIAYERSLTSAETAVTVAPAFSLEQNYPNPFNPSTRIRFMVPSTGHVSLVVYDVTGKEAARLVDGVLTGGEHAVSFDASRLAGGVYFYRMSAGAFTETRKMVLLR